MTPSRDAVFADLVREMNEGLIVPVFFGSALNGFGVRRLLKALRHECPLPARAAERLGIEAGAYVLKAAYREFEERVGRTRSPRGAKADLVRQAVRGQEGDFRLVDIERACPGVGREWIRRLLAEMKRAGEVACSGRGPAARWRRRAGKGTTRK